MKNLEQEYQTACETMSDIYEHLPILRKYASMCKHVTEMGVRSGQSSRAFLTESVILRSYDLYLEDGVVNLFEKARLIGKDVKYLVGNTLEITIENTDMLFIDTEHTYEQVTAELNLHHEKVNKFISFHDTDKPFGEEVLPAIVEFTIRNPQWHFIYHNKSCHGLTIISKLKL